MTATLLVSEFPSVQTPAVSKCVVGETLFLEPFPLLCAFICIHAGELKTIKHRHILSIVLAQTEHLRCIWTVGGVENRRTPVWVPRRAKDRKKFNHWRMQESRRHRTLTPPVWHGEKRPWGARCDRYQYEADRPTIDHLAYLCRELGYPIGVAIAAVALSTSRFSPDRRAAAVVNAENDGEELNWARDTHVIQDPEHPYIPACPARRTFIGGGFTVTQATRSLRNHNWTLAMHEAVIEVLVKRRPSKEVAARRQLNYQTLKGNAGIIKAEIQADLHVA
jgi:hypothetical protein